MSSTITAEAVCSAQIQNFSPDTKIPEFMEHCTGFMRLLEQVRAVAPEAAGILERMALDPKAYKKWHFVPSCALISTFAWDQTSEGHKFWSDLSRDLARQ